MSKKSDRILAQDLSLYEFTLRLYLKAGSRNGCGCFLSEIGIAVALACRRARWFSPICEIILESQSRTKPSIYSTRTEVCKICTFLTAIYTQFGDDIWVIQNRIQTESNSLRLFVACYGIIFINASR